MKRQGGLGETAGIGTNPTAGRLGETTLLWKLEIGYSPGGGRLWGSGLVFGGRGRDGDQRDAEGMDADQPL
jgi:hypothetical protein